MAINFSPSYVKNARRKARWTPLYFKRKLYHPIRIWRRLRLKTSPRRDYHSTAECFVTENFDKAAEHFRTHKWAFVEDVLSPEFHRELRENWPKKYFFEPPRDIEKSYDRGFFWYSGNDMSLQLYAPYAQHGSLRKFLACLNSSAFLARVNSLAGGHRRLSCYSFILTDAGCGSEVFPHMDSIAKGDLASDGINMMFFIDASGGERSGALTLYRDNEGKDIIFEPKNLKNSVLIYNTFVNFYHGFPPIAKGKFRRSIGVSFNDSKEDPPSRL